MRRSLRILAVVGILAACRSEPPPQRADEVRVDSALLARWTPVVRHEVRPGMTAWDSGSPPATLFFRDGTILETDLYNVQFIGLLPAQGKAPFLVLSAIGCTDCDMNESVYVHSPSDGPFRSPRSERRFSYAGTLVDLETDVTLEHTDVYLGECRSGASVLVWLTHVATQPPIDTVFQVTVRGDSLVSGYLPDSPAAVRAEVERAPRHRCTKLEGATRHTEP